jgi:hypothetical protein
VEGVVPAHLPGGFPSNGKHRHGSVLIVGSQTEGIGTLIERLQQLPGFDNEAVVAASSSTQNALYRCWERRTVTLRQERRGDDVRWLGASVDGAGALRVHGQDLGPGTAMVSSDGEYEWFMAVGAGDIDRLVALLGGRPGDDVLELLERDWTGSRSYDFERVLRESGIPVKLFTWGRLMWTTVDPGSGPGGTSAGRSGPATGPWGLEAVDPGRLGTTSHSSGRSGWRCQGAPPG